MSTLFSVLAVLIILSACFSGSETALMTLNRYRLRHLAKNKHRGALRVQQLLKRPDRLIGLILLGNNFVNILASSIATIIALRLWGEAGIAIAAGSLTLVILIFAEVTPKTLAAAHPEKIAFIAAYIYIPLLKILYPLVLLINTIANTLLRIIGFTHESNTQSLSRDELKTVVMEAGTLIPEHHQKMLLNLLDLETAQVEDIMVPRNEIIGIDINNDIKKITLQLTQTQYTRLPVYEDSIDQVIGFLHLRKALPLLQADQFNHAQLRSLLHDVYFIPEETSLNRLLLNLQHEKQRVGLIVNEYGDIQGLVTLEDILEEVVGEFTTDPADNISDIIKLEDDSFIVNASTSIREINRRLDIELPTDGPKTLNGLILEYLETIPEPSTSLLLSGYPLDIVQTQNNSVKTARIYPQKRQPLPSDEELEED